MHAKVTVADDTVFVGSFNLSRSGETNAENVLEIADAALAERMAAWIDELRARFPAPSVRSQQPARAAGALLPRDHADRRVARRAAGIVVEVGDALEAVAVRRPASRRGRRTSVALPGSRLSVSTPIAPARRGARSAYSTASVAEAGEVVDAGRVRVLERRRCRSTFAAQPEFISTAAPVGMRP